MEMRRDRGHGRQYGPDCCQNGSFYGYGSCSPGRHAIYACCAVDAVAIPAALGADARVTSRCHACGSAVAVTVSEGRIVEAAAGVIIWAADADPGRSLREYT